MIKIINTTAWFLTLVFAICFGTYAHAINPNLDWKTIETEHFRIHFHTGEAALAKKSASIAEYVHEELTRALSWAPDDKTELVLTDESDFANGAATPIPFNASYLLVTPPNEPNSLEDYDDWLRLLITHEYTHIIHLDKSSGFPHVMRKILGRSILFFPNLLQPNWLVEGLATYYETDTEFGVGRGQSSLFDMMIRTEVANGLKPLSQVNLPLRSWPGGTSAYLYGVYFFQFIEQRYGRNSLLRYIESNSNNVIPFRVNANTRQIFGKNMTDLWADYQNYLQTRFSPQLEAIRATSMLTGEALTTKGFTTGSPYAMADGSVYYLKNDGYSRPALMRRHADNRVEHIADVSNNAHLDIHQQAGALLSQANVCDNYYMYYDLYRIPVGSGSARRLTYCARYVFSSWSPDAKQILAVKMSLGQSSLHRLNADGELIQVLWQGKKDEVIGQIDWSPDGSQLVAAVWRTGNWNLERFDLQEKKWMSLTRDHWIQAQPRFTEDGQSIVYSADYNDVYNIYKIDLPDGHISKLTQVEGGAFAPSIANDTLYYSGYGATGFDLYRVTQSQAVGILDLHTMALRNVATEHNYDSNATNKLSVTQADDTSSLDMSDLTVKDYSPWASLRPRWLFPSVAAASGEGIWIGAMTGGNDVLRVHSYLLSAAYEIETSTFSTTAGYLYNNRLSLNLSRGADIDLDEDNDNEVQSVRIIDEFQLTYAYPFLYHDWRILLNVTLDEESTDEVGPGITPLADFKDGLTGIGFVFDNSQQFNFSISPADGRYVKLTAESSDTLNSDFSGEIFTLDWNEYIQLTGEHVLALRLVTGWGTDQPNPFRLGGATSNSSVNKTFNVRTYNLRGYDDNLPELSGRRMQLATSEWRFPMARIERGWMSPPLGLSQLSGRLFYEAGASWDEGSSADRYYRSAGTEVVADVNLFYFIELNIRAGYAHGFDDELGDDVVYISLVSSF